MGPDPRTGHRRMEATVTVNTLELDEPTTHRSFRLTRGGGDPVGQQVSPSLVMPDRDIRAVVVAVGREDVAAGGCFSVGPAGVQLWSGPWDGALGGRGESQHLGSTDWSYDTPVLQYVTIYRVLVTAAGLAAGHTTDSVLARVLGAAGLRTPVLTPEAIIPAARDPFRSSALRRR